jgi:hypothetical protein
MALRAHIAGVTGHDMEQEITSHRVGDATVIKIAELALDAVEPCVLYPDQRNLAEPCGFEGTHPCGSRASLDG